LDTVATGTESVPINSRIHSPSGGSPISPTRPATVSAAALLTFLSDEVQPQETNEMKAVDIGRKVCVTDETRAKIQTFFDVDGDDEA